MMTSQADVIQHLFKSVLDIEDIEIAIINRK